jgi:two-component system, NtrC family, nitrogen regulation response regulator NtrX
MTADSAAPSRRSVLIVDDDLSLLDALERAFMDAGETTVARGSFEEGRQALRERRFDVLITDVRLGAFNGLQLAVLARDLWPDIRVIVFSGFDDPVLRADAEHVGATYLVKPVTSATLLELVRR